MGRETGWMLAILACALLLRTVWIESLPPAIHQDEASNGVDAWSLLTTGADRAGRAWPVFLEGFGAGDNRTSLYAILAIPAVAALGPGAAATRAPAALVGVLTVLAVFLFLRRVRGTRVALVGAAFLAADPWHLYLSRFGHEASLTPIFLVAGLWLCAPSSSGGSAKEPPVARLVLTGLVLGAGLYSYASYRLFLPVLLLAALALPGLPRRRRAIAILCVGLLGGALPLLIATGSHPERLLARARAAAVFGNVEPLGSALLLILRQYLAHFLPGFLAVHGDANPLHSPPGGQLLWVELVALLAGVVLALRRRDGWDRFFLLWLLLYPIASATTLGDRPAYVPHALRAAVGLPVFQILAAQGCVAGIEAIERRSRPAARGAVAILTIALVLQLLLVSALSAMRWRIQVAPLYHASYPPAMRVLAERRGELDAVVIGCADNPQAYVYAILYGVQDPREYQNAEKEIAQTETFHLVRRAGNLYYVHEPADLARLRSLLHGRVGVVGWEGQLRTGRLLASFPGAAGGPRLEVREIDLP